jgi:Ser/Thr protein kinase RdoA (MazF antagonist)
VLAELRALVAPGTRLALSLRHSSEVTSRPAFERYAAAVGEPAANMLAADNATSVFTAGRWKAVELSERARTAGFMVLEPEWTPHRPPLPATIGVVGHHLDRTFGRTGAEQLAEHLSATYEVGIRRLVELQPGVHRAELLGGARWIARVFPAEHPTGSVQAHAELLCWLEGVAFPAERSATPGPVSSHEGQDVLVTVAAPGRALPGAPASYERMGDLLGRLHALPLEPSLALRPGGGWHHVAPDGGPGDEIAAGGELLRAAGHRVPGAQRQHYDILLDALDTCRLEPDLPSCIVHPDLVAPNVLRDRAGHETVVDWAGAGLGPRVGSLGCLLWTAAANGDPCVESVWAGYARHVQLTPEELGNLEVAMSFRPLVLAIWSLAAGTSTAEESASWWTAHRQANSRALPRLRELARRANLGPWIQSAPDRC